MILNIGAPSLITNDAQLDYYYSRLRVREDDSFIKISEELHRFNSRIKFQPLALYELPDRTVHCGEAAAPNSWFDVRGSVLVKLDFWIF